MATDVDVQFFSHLNGLTLGNNWGDLIRLLDKALVTGIDFTQITAASIDAQGDVHITLYSDHNAMLFQVVELTGFAPASFNQKYRIKGVPNTTQLILKPHAAITETSITTVGAGKLASLDYDIIFRDANDVKRVYRAKNPTAQHPFIRVDESLTSPDGATGVYASTYAKYALVGLLEHMEHIDDYQNPDVLQLPFDPADPAKNWKITGTGTACVRGWSRWYWMRNVSFGSNSTTDSSALTNINKNFLLCGDKDAFFLTPQVGTGAAISLIYGVGLYTGGVETTVQNKWFLASTVTQNPVSASWSLSSVHNVSNDQGLLVPTFNELNPLQAHSKGVVVGGVRSSGAASTYLNTIPAIDLPIAGGGYLLGNLPHLKYAGTNLSSSNVDPNLSETSMYVAQSSYLGGATTGGFYYYLGELE